MGFLTDQSSDLRSRVLPFQSLIGIGGFFNGEYRLEFLPEFVSIPNRDWWVF